MVPQNNSCAQLFGCDQKVLRLPRPVKRQPAIQPHLLRVRIRREQLIDGSLFVEL